MEPKLPGGQPKTNKQLLTEVSDEVISMAGRGVADTEIKAEIMRVVTHISRANVNDDQTKRDNLVTYVNDLLNSVSLSSLRITDSDLHRNIPLIVVPMASVAPTSPAPAPAPIASAPIAPPTASPATPTLVGFRLPDTDALNLFVNGLNIGGATDIGQLLDAGVRFREKLEEISLKQAALNKQIAGAVGDTNISLGQRTILTYDAPNYGLEKSNITHVLNTSKRLIDKIDIELVAADATATSLLTVMRESHTAIVSACGIFLKKANEKNTELEAAATEAADKLREDQKIKKEKILLEQEAYDLVILTPLNDPLFDKDSNLDYEQKIAILSDKYIGPIKDKMDEMVESGLFVDDINHAYTPVTSGGFFRIQSAFDKLLSTKRLAEGIKDKAEAVKRQFDGDQYFSARNGIISKIQEIKDRLKAAKDEAAVSAAKSYADTVVNEYNRRIGLASKAKNKVTYEEYDSKTKQLKKKEKTEEVDLVKNPIVLDIVFGHLVREMEEIGGMAPAGTVSIYQARINEIKKVEDVNKKIETIKKVGEDAVAIINVVVSKIKMYGIAVGTTPNKAAYSKAVANINADIITLNNDMNAVMINLGQSEASAAGEPKIIDAVAAAQTAIYKAAREIDKELNTNKSGDVIIGNTARAVEGSRDRGIFDSDTAYQRINILPYTPQPAAAMPAAATLPLPYPNQAAQTTNSHAQPTSPLPPAQPPMSNLSRYQNRGGGVGPTAKKWAIGVGAAVVVAAALFMAGKMGDDRRAEREAKSKAAAAAAADEKAKVIEANIKKAVEALKATSNKPIGKVDTPRDTTPRATDAKPIATEEKVVTTKDASPRAADTKPSASQNTKSESPTTAAESAPTSRPAEIREDTLGDYYKEGKYTDLPAAMSESKSYSQFDKNLQNDAAFSLLKAPLFELTTKNGTYFITRADMLKRMDGGRDQRPKTVATGAVGVMSWYHDKDKTNEVFVVYKSTDGKNAGLVSRSDIKANIDDIVALTKQFKGNKINRDDLERGLLKIFEGGKDSKRVNGLVSICTSNVKNMIDICKANLKLTD